MTMVFGFFFMVGSNYLLWHNEGRAVQTALSLDEGLGLCNNVFDPFDASAVPVGQLVHMNGPISFPAGPIADVEFDVTAEVSRLKRVTEMYQWHESKSTREYKEGDSIRTETTYNYRTKWATSHHGNFHKAGYDNPRPPPWGLGSMHRMAVTMLGAYELAEGLVEQISTWSPLTPTTNTISSGGMRLTLQGNAFFSGSPSSPRVGDLRVTYKTAGHRGDQVSVVAMKAGPKPALRSFQTRAGDRLEMLSLGFHTKEAMFADAVSANGTLTWGLRLLGFVLMWVSFAMMASPVTTLVSWIPFISGLVELASCLMTFCLAASLSLITIALGWIWFRPALGGTLLALAVVPILLGNLTGNRQKSKSL